MDYGLVGSFVCRGFTVGNKGSFMDTTLEVMKPLAPSDCDLQCALGRFAADCGAAGMRVRSFRSEAALLRQKNAGLLLPLGRMVKRCFTWIGAVMQELQQAA